ncbi:uncharacterized protein LOC121829541 isoform X1 [Peromyscus maniculatus bairdii]|uniref:uncharacterized protein LOC121829541 isoform X1 n=1 Tax=Peromyscus maniculatus bairdii TaxID=230844 RepID=UPI003FD0765E
MTQVSQKQTLKFPAGCSACFPGLGRRRILGFARSTSTSTALSASQPSGGSRIHVVQPRTLRGSRGQRRAGGDSAERRGVTRGRMASAGWEEARRNPRGDKGLRTWGEPGNPLPFLKGIAPRTLRGGAGPRHLGRLTSKWQPRGSRRPAGDGAGEGGERDIFGHSLARHSAEEAPPRSRKRGSRVTRALWAPAGGGRDARVGDRVPP